VRHGVVNFGKRNPSCLHRDRLWVRLRKTASRVDDFITFDMRIYSPPRRLYGLESCRKTVGTGNFVYFRRKSMVASSDSVLILGMNVRATLATSSKPSTSVTR
jgi:hypothetical protein